MGFQGNYLYLCKRKAGRYDAREKENAATSPKTSCHWKLGSQETDSPLEFLERVETYWHPSVSLVILISDFWLPELSDNNFLLFKANRFAVICNSIQRKLIGILVLKSGVLFQKKKKKIPNKVDVALELGRKSILREF